MRIFLSALSFLALLSCGGSNPGPDAAQFSDNPTLSPIQPGQIDEASGMADSRSMPGNLWVHQDSGSPAELALLGHDGRVKGKIPVPNAQNRDWEDMSIGPGPRDGVTYLYIGEIGDNNGQYESCAIYRFPEPANLNTPISGVERITFRYPDGPRDAESLLVDPLTRDIYIISKGDNPARVYRLPYPQSTSETLVAQAMGQVSISIPTGATISPDGTEIIIRDYLNVTYWKRQAGESVADAIQRRAGRRLPYRAEPQGEAVSFEREAKGYFTLSERFNAPSVNLFYYARK